MILLLYVLLLSLAPALAQDNGTCALEGYSRCADRLLPSTFCCPASTTCISLARATSAVCCPAGSDCKSIRPIVCDISFQDVRSFPGSAFHTSNFSYVMQTCGSGCCPAGYNCRDQKCVMASESPDLGGAPVTIGNSTDPISHPSQTKCSKYPGGAVAAGFFPGMILGALIAGGPLWFLHTREQQRKPTLPFGRGTASVSEPISASPNNRTLRTDFLRRMSRLRPGTRSTPAMSSNHHSFNIMPQTRSVLSSPAVPSNGVSPSMYNNDFTATATPQRLQVPRSHNLHERPITPQLPMPPMPMPPRIGQMDFARSSHMTDGGQTTFSALLSNEDSPPPLFSRRPVEPRAL